MGVLDIPAPLFAWLDERMGQLVSPGVRLVLWGVIGAAVSMGLYWLISPQEKIKRNAAKSIEARRALDAYEGDFAGAWPQIREMLRLSFKQIGIVTLPAVIASLPVLCLLVWMSTVYGYYFPNPPSSAEVHSFPKQHRARWMNDDNANDASRPLVPRIEVLDDRGHTANIIPLPLPVPTVHKYQWWNVLFGNPVGYLPDNAKIDRVEIDLPEQEFLSFGPSWLRSWEFLFLSVVLIVSIAIKVAFRIK